MSSTPRHRENAPAETGAVEPANAEPPAERARASTMDSTNLPERSTHEGFDRRRPRRRRSAVQVPTIVSPMDAPEDAEGRVEIIVVRAPADVDEEETPAEASTAPEARPPEDGAEVEPSDDGLPEAETEAESPPVEMEEVASEVEFLNVEPEAGQPPAERAETGSSAAEPSAGEPSLGDPEVDRPAAEASAELPDRPAESSKAEGAEEDPGVVPEGALAAIPPTDPSPAAASAPASSAPATGIFTPLLALRDGWVAVGALAALLVIAYLVFSAVFR